MNRLTTSIIVVIVSALFIGAYALLRSEANNELTATSIRFPIPLVEAGQTGFYVAKEKGYYADEGLDVTFEHSTSTLGPIRAVATEIDDFGMIGGLDALLVARGKGRPLVAVGILHKDATFVALYSLKNSGLTTVADLEGRRLGFFYGHISEVFIRAYLLQERVTVQEVGMEYYDYSKLTSGEVDAMPGFKATVLPDVEDKGIDVNTIDPADAGMVMQGYTLFVTESLARREPELIVKFLRATFRGYRDSSINPDEGIDLLVKHDANLSAATELKRLPFYQASMSTAPYGYMDDDMFQMTYDRLETLGLITSSFDVHGAFDSSFVNKAAVREAGRE